MELVININQFELNEISNSREFKLLKDNKLAKVVSFEIGKYSTDYINVVEVRSAPDIGRYYGGLVSHQKNDFEGRVNKSYYARRIIKNPSVRAKSTKCRYYYLVIDLSPKNFIPLGIVGGMTTATILANPLIMGIVTAIGTIIMTYMHLKAPFYMISEEEANFYSYLSASCFNSKEVTSIKEIKRIYEEDFLNVIKVINPSYELKEDFESIYDYFTNNGLIYQRGGEYKISTTIKILNRKFGRRR